MKPRVVDRAGGAYAEAPFMLRIAKVFADPLRIKILAELNLRDMSPTRFYEQFGGGSVTRVYRHFKVLQEYGWLIKVGEKSGGQRRGATENFYRATAPAVLDNPAWSGLPEPMKGPLTGKIFEHFAERVTEAMEGNTIDARDDSHFTSTSTSLDQLGWENVVAKIDAAFHFVFEEQERAKARMAESGEEPIPVTVGLATFESPPGSIRTESGDENA